MYLPLTFYLWDSIYFPTSFARIPWIDSLFIATAWRQLSTGQITLYEDLPCFSHLEYPVYSLYYPTYLENSLVFWQQLNYLLMLPHGTTTMDTLYWFSCVVTWPHFIFTTYTNRLQCSSSSTYMYINKVSSFLYATAWPTTRPTVDQILSVFISVGLAVSIVMPICNAILIDLVTV